MLNEKIGNVNINYDYYKDKDYYNEGDYEESIILESLKSETPYLETLSKHSEWAILYQLSPERKNIIGPMDIKKTDRVLEIGAGMGAVTGAIASRCLSVDCVELSKRRSLANAYRNKKFENINIYVGNFKDIQFSEKYDVITLIGVFEYAQSFINTEDPYIDFLKKIKELLKHDGKLYIAIENKLGLKYFAGCAEDHTGVIFKGIEGYTSTDPAVTFTKSEITKILNDSGFGYTYFYYPYPDYKLPSVIYSQDYLLDDTFSLCMKYSYDMPRKIYFDEDKVYKNISNLKELEMLSNSFLIEAKFGEN